MKSLQDQIVAWLAQEENKGQWFPKGQLTDDMIWQYVEKGETKTAMSDTVSRKLRLCEEEKRIAVKPYGESVQYRFLPPDKRSSYIPTSERPEGKQNTIFHEFDEVEKPKQRTLSQNAALHLYLELLSNELNDSGHDMRKVLKETVDIPWSKDTAKKFLWKPIQEIMVDKGHTAELTTAEVDKIYKVLDRHISEKCGVHIEWPSIDNTEEAINSIKE